MARYIDAVTPDLLKIVDPTGITVTSPWTWMGLVQFKDLSASDGRGIMKLGDDNASSFTRGIYIGTNAGDKIVIRGNGIGTDPSNTTFVVDTWYEIAIVYSGGGISLWVDGTVDSAINAFSIGTIPALDAGDAYAIGRGHSPFGIASADLYVAAHAWLAGVALNNGTSLDSYFADPCSLDDDYGSGGGVTADALKLLGLGDQSADLSDVGQTISLTGGAEVAGPTDYPVSCAAGGDTTTLTAAITDAFLAAQGDDADDFDTDTIKIAAYNESAALSASTAAYSATNEVTGDGYTAGGEVVTFTKESAAGNNQDYTAGDVVWTAADTGAVAQFLLYNASKSNRSIAVFTAAAALDPAGLDMTVPFSGLAQAIRFARS